jgi:hypothetical protein
MRQVLLYGSAACFLMIAHEASAVDLPIRKPGLWEMKVAGSRVVIAWRGQRDIDRSKLPSLSEMTILHCTDESTDKEMHSDAWLMRGGACSRQDVQKTPAGYVTDSVCDVGGVSVASHSEITGDLNSAYTVKSTSHSEGHAPNVRDSTTTVEAKWLGDCKSDQKSGDIEIPGAFKINVMDIKKTGNEGNMYLRPKPAP